MRAGLHHHDEFFAHRHTETNAHVSYMKTIAKNVNKNIISVDDSGDGPTGTSLVTSIAPLMKMSNKHNEPPI
jgi:hypothetical protein